MKKNISILLAAILGLSVFSFAACCGGEETKKITEESTTIQKPVADANDAQGDSSETVTEIPTTETTAPTAK